jgi:hypothetical protein
MSIRDTRDEMRRALHDALAVPALYVVETETPGEYEVVPAAGADGVITVRLHTSKTTMGEVKGTSFDYAERLDIVPYIIFLASQVTPEHNVIVSIEPGEAWRVDAVEPRDGITITATVKRIRDTAGIPILVSESEHALSVDGVGEIEVAP